MRILSILYLLLIAAGCKNKPALIAAAKEPVAVPVKEITDTVIPNTAKVIHVFVALCDNKNQGIVPVPKAIGNGQDPASNLYWGCAGGVKGFFKKSKDWKLLSTEKNPATNILERCVFKHIKQDAYLLADAYDGAAIKQCTIDFLEATAGNNNRLQNMGDTTIAVGGSAQLISYIGHNGLMDFSLNSYPKSKHDKKRETIILACISKRYFKEGLQQSGARPLLWSTGLMAPEAYTLEAAIAGWLQNETNEQIRMRAAKAYDRYQHYGVNAAAKLLVTGW